MVTLLRHQQIFMCAAPNTYLFFYGSLKQDFPMQERLGIRQALTFVQNVSLAGDLYDLGAYPAMVKGTGQVHGELFCLSDPSLMAILDEYEAYDPSSPDTSLYVRELTSCGERSVWVYRYQGDLRFAERLVEGIWPKASG